MSEENADSVVDSLRNLVDYGVYRSPFHDAFAQFSVDFSGAAVGVGRTLPRAVQHTFQVTDATSLVWLVEDGQPAALMRQDLDCWPACCEERAQVPVASGGVLSVRAEHVFLDERTLASRFVFRNDGSAPMTLRPRWQGILPGDVFFKPASFAEFEGINVDRRVTFLEAVSGGIRGGMRVESGAPDQPQMALTLRCVSHPLRAWVGDSPGWTGDETRPSGYAPAPGKPAHYWLGVGEERTLAPKTECAYQFILHVAYAWHQRPQFDWPPESRFKAVDFDAVKRERSQAFCRRINTTSLPRTGHVALDIRLARARYALLRTGVRGMDGEFGDNLACLCSSDAGGFSTVFFWDSLFSSAAIADFHPEYARGAILAAFTRQSPRDGSSPENKYNYTIPQRFHRQFPQAPVGTWAVERYLARNPDPEFLREVYPRLTENHRFFEEFSDTDRDGLAEWRWTGQTADNSPLYDLCVPGTGCGWIPPIASVSLNSFLYRDAVALARLAEQQGLAEAARWRARAETIFKRFMEICYVPAERRFWDFNHHTGQHRRVKTFYMFWPLFAGMPIPEAAARDLVENVLLDPRQFFGAIPFPSVAYDEPSYDPAGYWRGKAWPHISFWLLETLVRLGYAKQAKEAARRIVAWYSAQPGFYENLNTNPNEAFPSAVYDYNWGCAGFYLTATGAYAR